MYKGKLSALLFALVPVATFAGGMGEVAVPQKLLFLEAGFSYSHSFFNDHVVTAESQTVATPKGVSIDPSDFYPDDFYGGYIGASLYTSDWLLNARYDMYGKESQFNSSAGTNISLAPAKLSLSVDRVFGDINSFSYGLGAGAVVETTNDGDALINSGDSESIQGRGRIDPLVEGFVMYRLANNFGVKFNAAYQIGVNHKFGDGDLNLNLGVNYAFPI